MVYLRVFGPSIAEFAGAQRGLLLSRHGARGNAGKTDQKKPSASQTASADHGDAAGLLKARTASPRPQAKSRDPAATKQPDGQITSGFQK